MRSESFRNPSTCIRGVRHSALVFVLSYRFSTIVRCVCTDVHRADLLLLLSGFFLFPSVSVSFRFPRGAGPTNARRTIGFDWPSSATCMTKLAVVVKINRTFLNSVRRVRRRSDNRFGCVRHFQLLFLFFEQLSHSSYNSIFNHEKCFFFFLFYRHGHFANISLKIFYNIRLLRLLSNSF